MTTASNVMPPEWLQGLEALRQLPEGGAALLIGGTDRGKTTFTTVAARLLAAEFERVAIIDADIGQSEIGPPGTVGGAWATPDAVKLHDLKPAAVFFVGAFAPVSVALEQVVAVAQAVQWARGRGAQRILIDTTGFIAGPAARRLKAAKAQASQPNLVLGIAKDNELDGLLTVTGAVSGAKTLLLPTPESVGRKSTTLRQTRRLARLSQALSKAREVTLPLSQVSTVGATLGTGDKIPPHLVQWAGNALHLPAVYAEKAEGTLTLFLRGPQAQGGLESGATPVAEHFGARTVRVLSLDAYSNTYLGLHDAAGRLLCVGRFLRLDPEREEIVLSAPLPSPTAAERFRLVSFGRVRIAEDGAFLSDIKPGEI
ncbi:MAG: Clp1/GlmU family protein [Armatimonadota bacterium]